MSNVKDLQNSDLHRFLEDFNPALFVKDHSALQERLNKLEEKFGSPIQIADTLLETSRVASKVDEMLLERLLILMRNEDIKKSIVSIIDSVDRKYIATQLKKYGTWIGAAVLFIMAQISTELIHLIIKHFSN